MHRLMMGLVACAACGTAAAEERRLSYTYAEGGFYRLDLQNAEIADGLSLGGSFAFGTNWFAFAEFDLIELEFVDVDTDSEGLRLGAGGYWPLVTGLDATARVGWVDFNVDQASGEVVDDSGPLLAVGLRGRPAAQAEWDAEVEYINYDTGGDSTALVLGGRYYFQPRLSAGARLGMSDDRTEVRVLVRYSFQ